MRNQEIKISIITASYNVFHKIKSTLASAFLLNNPSLFEYIVIDGGSSDGTLSVLKHYYSLYPCKFSFVSEPDNGVYDALNKAIKAAQGDYLYFLGAGDTLKPGILEEFFAPVACDADLIYGRVHCLQNGAVTFGEYDKTRIVQSHLCHQAVFYHRSLFMRYGLYDLKYPLLADHVLHLKLFGDDSVSKSFIDKVIATYEQGGLSDHGKDPDYVNDIESLITEALGNEYIEIYRQGGKKAFDYKKYGDNKQRQQFECEKDESFSPGILFDSQLIPFLLSIQPKVIGIFGCGEQGIRTLKRLGAENYSPSSLCFFDNDESLWGTEVCGVKVSELDFKKLSDCDAILIASMWEWQIRSQLLALGIIEEKIYTVRR